MFQRGFHIGELPQEENHSQPTSFDIPEFDDTLTLDANLCNWFQKRLNTSNPLTEVIPLGKLLKDIFKRVLEYNTVNALFQSNRQYEYVRRRATIIQEIEDTVIELRDAKIAQGEESLTQAEMDTIIQNRLTELNYDSQRCPYDPEIDGELDQHELIARENFLNVSSRQNHIQLHPNRIHYSFKPYNFIKLLIDRDSNELPTLSILSYMNDFYDHKPHPGAHFLSIIGEDPYLASKFFIALRQRPVKERITWLGWEWFFIQTNLYEPSTRQYFHTMLHATNIPIEKYITDVLQKNNDNNEENNNNITMNDNDSSQQVPQSTTATPPSIATTPAIEASYKAYIAELTSESTNAALIASYWQPIVNYNKQQPALLSKTQEIFPAANQWLGNMVDIAYKPYATTAFQKSIKSDITPINQQLPPQPSFTTLTPFIQSHPLLSKSTIYADMLSLWGFEQPTIPTMVSFIHYISFLVEEIRIFKNAHVFGLGFTPARFIQLLDWFTYALAFVSLHTPWLPELTLPISKLINACMQVSIYNPSYVDCIDLQPLFNNVVHDGLQIILRSHIIIPYMMNYMNKCPAYPFQDQLKFIINPMLTDFTYQRRLLAVLTAIGFEHREINRFMSIAALPGPEMTWQEPIVRSNGLSSLTFNKTLDQLRFSSDIKDENGELIISEELSCILQLLLEQLKLQRQKRIQEINENDVQGITRKIDPHFEDETFQYARIINEYVREHCPIDPYHLDYIYHNPRMKPIPTDGYDPLSISIAQRQGTLDKNNIKNIVTNIFDELDGNCMYSLLLYGFVSLECQLIGRKSFEPYLEYVINSTWDYIQKQKEKILQQDQLLPLHEQKYNNINIDLIQYERSAHTYEVNFHIEKHSAPTIETTILLPPKINTLTNEPDFSFTMSNITKTTTMNDNIKVDTKTEVKTSKSTQSKSTSPTTTQPKSTSSSTSTTTTATSKSTTSSSTTQSTSTPNSFAFNVNFNTPQPTSQTTSTTTTQSSSSTPVIKQSDNPTVVYTKDIAPPASFLAMANTTTSTTTTPAITTPITTTATTGGFSFNFTNTNNNTNSTTTTTSAPITTPASTSTTSTTSSTSTGGFSFNFAPTTTTSQTTTVPNTTTTAPTNTTPATTTTAASTGGFTFNFDANTTTTSTSLTTPSTTTTTTTAPVTSPTTTTPATSTPFLFNFTPTSPPPTTTTTTTLSTTTTTTPSTFSFNFTPTPATTTSSTTSTSSTSTTPLTFLSSKESVTTIQSNSNLVSRVAISATTSASYYALFQSTFKSKPFPHQILSAAPFPPPQLSSQPNNDYIAPQRGSRKDTHRSQYYYHSIYHYISDILLVPPTFTKSIYREVCNWIQLFLTMPLVLYGLIPHSKPNLTIEEKNKYTTLLQKTLDVFHFYGLFNFHHILRSICVDDNLQEGHEVHYLAYLQHFYWVLFTILFGYGGFNTFAPLSNDSLFPSNEHIPPVQGRHVARDFITPLLNQHIGKANNTNLFSFQPEPQSNDNDDDINTPRPNQQLSLILLLLTRAFPNELHQLYDFNSIIPDLYNPPRSLSYLFNHAMTIETTYGTYIQRLSWDNMNADDLTPQEIEIRSKCQQWLMNIIKKPITMPIMYGLWSNPVLENKKKTTTIKSTKSTVETESSSKISDTMNDTDTIPIHPHNDPNNPKNCIVNVMDSFARLMQISSYVRSTLNWSQQMFQFYLTVYVNLGLIYTKEEF